ncbi:hypothetical protein [Neorhizobium alkalisoli]|uniref:Uncharacterized protein n=1 Tax=Neorhizobium alkalisoli TaxID=528178 RepID=A0A561QS94_9HYPH|nr:hypothetical protein [Neorhizobium alkalisoli]TWF53268.1 hypothetical protein FHW37_104545 [Neorhizobium alkalisoli]
MARLLSWPLGLRWNRWKWLAGPEAVGASSDTTIGDFTQTIASPFGARAMQITFPPLRGAPARRARGLITALNKGANAVRVSICDWDGMKFAEAGTSITQQQIQDGMPFSNGLGWSNGENWQLTKPLVPVASSAAQDATVIRLSTAFWGGLLGMGDWIGFSPLHFGLYEITEEMETAGQYRIWPPLRKDIASGSFSTLYPVMAMRLMANNLPDAERGPSHLENLSISLVEVFDYDVRDYFLD